FAITLYYLVRDDRPRFPRRLVVASLAAFAMPMVALVTGWFVPVTKLLFDALLNRMFLNSGFLSFVYFKYFADHPHVHFANVKPINLFLTSPYRDAYPVALSWDVWGAESDPNANFLADGFAQLGTAGLPTGGGGLARCLRR